jgi:hypothetical protein
MSDQHGFCHAEAFLDDQITALGDWCAPQLIELALCDDHDELQPAWAALTSSQARHLAFRLLMLAELADHRARDQADQR